MTTVVDVSVALCLGKGAFGEVYLAKLTGGPHDAQTVAIKVLRPDLANPTLAAQRLRDEARMLQALDHPSIPALLDLIVIEDRLALMTEYIEGIDLARCLRPGALLPARAVLGVTATIAEVIHAAWSAPSPVTGKPLRLVHRDVKPENIRLSHTGEVKLLDFGLARTTQLPRDARTDIGEEPVTPGYAAPELFTDQRLRNQADVFALGASVFRMLSGKRLFDSPSLRDHVPILTDQRRYETHLRGRLSAVRHPATHALLQGMLAWDPAERATPERVQRQAENIASTLGGPDHTRWARSRNFPAPMGLPGAPLTGRTVRAQAVLQTAPPVKFVKPPTHANDSLSEAITMAPSQARQERQRMSDAKTVLRDPPRLPPRVPQRTPQSAPSRSTPVPAGPPALPPALAEKATPVALGTRDLGPPQLRSPDLGPPPPPPNVRTATPVSMRREQQPPKVQRAPEAPKVQRATEPKPKPTKKKPRTSLHVPKRGATPAPPPQAAPPTRSLPPQQTDNTLRLFLVAQMFIMVVLLCLVCILLGVVIAS